MRNKWTVRLGAVILVTVVTILFTTLAQANNPPTLVNSINTTLTTPAGVQITLVSVEKRGSQLFFNFHAYNGGMKDTSVVGTKGDFQFYYIKEGKFTPVLIMTQPDLATHHALPSHLAGGASADGWVMFDTAIAGTYPHQILYRFGAVADVACTNPQDKSTCHADEAYQALVWNF